LDEQTVQKHDASQRKELECCHANSKYGFLIQVLLLRLEKWFAEMLLPIPTLVAQHLSLLPSRLCRRIEVAAEPDKRIGMETKSDGILAG
jgi:hypothetical protein